jgi:phosphoribosylformylglycinamidine synthase
MKFGIVVFPGSNCDEDTVYVLKTFFNQEVIKLWHKDSDLQNCDCIVLPGGFSYGDYLRTGAISALSPLMNEIKKFVKEGGYVIGICNGFQILCESGLLPGVLIRNENLKFICEDVQLKVVNNQTAFSSGYQLDEIITVPIAHGEGNYYCEPAVLKELEQNNQIVFKYEGKNPNGSLANIAGICNKEKTVLGMMPHPERCAESVLGNNQGLKVFESILKAVPALVR